MHLWLGDERCVPDGDPDSNAQMVRESLLATEPRSRRVLHALPRPEQPEDAAWLYGRELCELVPDVVFDMVLLGMGPDGHTASLFAGYPALAVTEAPVARCASRPSRRPSA